MKNKKIFSRKAPEAGDLPVESPGKPRMDSRGGIQAKPDVEKSWGTIQPLTLDSVQMAQLVGLADIERSADSPLPDLGTTRGLDPKFMQELIEKGWIDRLDVSRLHDQALANILALKAPKTSVRLVLGSANELSSTRLFSADGFRDHALVLYTYHEKTGQNVIRPDMSPADVSNSLLAHLFGGPNREALQFNLHLPLSSALVYLGVLDLIHTRQLEARLRNETYPKLNMTAKDIWLRISEIWMGEDLMWLSALVPFLFADLDFDVNEKNIKKQVKEMVEKDFLTPPQNGFMQPSEFTIGLSEALLPVVSFGTVGIVSDKGEGLNLTFVIGLGTNLVVEAVPVKDQTLLNINGVSGTEIFRLLFEIGLPEDERATQAVKSTAEEP